MSRSLNRGTPHTSHPAPPGEPGVPALSGRAHRPVRSSTASPGRKKYAAVEPTPEEAHRALTTYGSYFGPYEVNDRESYEVTRQAGGMNPAQAGQLAVRFLGFVGNNRFIEKAPPAILDGQLVQ